MSTSTTSYTAAEIMDRSAVLMNDPEKTDYTYTVLMPFLKMALDELSENLADTQGSPTTTTSAIITVPAGTSGLYPVNSLNTPNYPSDLVEIQEIGERSLGSAHDEPYVPMDRVEFKPAFPPGDRLRVWAWENQIISLNLYGATTARQIRLKYVRQFNQETITPDSIVGSINSQSYLAYKTAAYAAMFIGENKERAEILDSKAEAALERIESINNKGRQQMMTRHRPFRASWKMRGGY